ncbi:MAG: hypothetical protein R2712_14535 [Vicinamibacterales bacterium]
MTQTPIRWMALATAVALLASPVIAQEQVTIVQRDGGKVSGRFEDWAHNTDTLYVRVSQPDQRRIPLGSVLVIDVGGNGSNFPASETDAAQGSEHVLVTRSGEVLKGRLLNIEGGDGSAKPNEPRTVSFNAGSERRFRMSEVARIYLGNYPRQSSATPPAAENVPAGSVRLPANQQWTATNITIRRGDRVQFSAQGEIQLSADANDKAAPAGSSRTAPNAPAPQLPAGALIGRIGGGAPFGIGNQTNPLPMPGAGPLWLGINDDVVDDNAGAFVVSIRVIRGR